MRALLSISATLCLAISVPTIAGEIYGTLRMDDKPLGGVVVEVRTETKTHQATTNADGSYRLYIEMPGKATLLLQYNKQTLSREIWSYDNSARYDLLIQNHNGTYVLIRK